jgi:hypothetical protein
MGGWSMSAASPFEHSLTEEALRSDLAPIEKGIALVLTPDTADFRIIRDAAIWPALSACGFVPTPDLAFDSGASLSYVARWVRGAELIVADVTGRNPDVMYALGLCHGLGRYPLLTSQDPSALPFGLRSLRCISYWNDTGGLWVLREDLSRAARVFMAAAETSREQ